MYIKLLFIPTSWSWVLASGLKGQYIIGIALGVPIDTDDFHQLCFFCFWESTRLACTRVTKLAYSSNAITSQQSTLMAYTCLWCASFWGAVHANLETRDKHLACPHSMFSWDSGYITARHWQLQCPPLRSRIRVCFVLRNLVSHSLQQKGSHPRLWCFRSWRLDIWKQHPEEKPQLSETALPEPPVDLCLWGQLDK